jgi:threonine/homoserine/homoserine lactone efflux protein
LIGYGMLTVIVAAGLGAVVAGASPVLTVLTALGAGYLTYLGVSLLRHPGSLRADTDPARLAGASAGSHVLRGVGVSGLNPKGLLIFLAVLPQVIDARGAWPIRVQLAALGLVFVATCGGLHDHRTCRSSCLVHQIGGHPPRLTHVRHSDDRPRCHHAH